MVPAVPAAPGCYYVALIFEFSFGVALPLLYEQYWRWRVTPKGLPTQAILVIVSSLLGVSTGAITSNIS